MHSVASIFISLLAASVAQVAAQEHSQDPVPPTGSMSLGSTTVNDGAYNGCPKGSVGSTIAQDNSFMTLIFDKFSAQTGPGTPASSRRVFCDVDVNINAPAGWQFCAMKADYRGYMNLDKNINATVRAHYSFGRGEEGKLQKNINGPMTQDFLFSQEGDTKMMLWSPCDTDKYTLKMKLQMALTSTDRNANGIIVTDSADAKFKQQLHLGWKPCPVKPANQPKPTGYDKTQHQCH